MSSITMLHTYQVMCLVELCTVNECPSMVRWRLFSMRSELPRITSSPCPAAQRSPWTEGWHLLCWRRDTCGCGKDPPPGSREDQHLRRRNHTPSSPGTPLHTAAPHLLLPERHLPCSVQGSSPKRHCTPLTLSPKHNPPKHRNVAPSAFCVQNTENKIKDR